MQNTIRIHDSKTIETIAFLAIALAIISLASVCMQQAKADTLSVSVTPGGPLRLDVGQDVTLTANPAGGTGPYTGYQWYLDGAAVGGAIGQSYDYTPGSAGSVLVTVTVNDSSPATSDPSSPVTLATEATLNTPTAAASSVSINRGQGSTLSVTGLSGGTVPYSYQWLSKAPGAGSFSPISGATSSTYLFSTTGATAFGTWHFTLQVTDSATTQVTVTSTEATVEVCPVVSFATNAAMTSDALGTVLTIDSVPYTYSNLQTQQFTTWKIGSTHTVAATSPVSVAGGVKQYVFQNWANGNGLVTSSGTFTTPAADTPVIANYQTQVQNTFNVTGIAGSDSVVLTGTYMGTGGSTIATLNAVNSWSASAWSDYNTAITFSAASSGSSSNERWAINGAYTTASLTTGGNTYSQLYTHQYSCQLSYSISGGSTPTTPTLTYTQFGTAGPSAALPTSPSTYWLDAGQAWSVTNPLGSPAATERWISNQTVSGIASATSPTASGGYLVFLYNHQYEIAVDPPSNGQITPSATAFYNAGSSQVFYISALNGYSISGITIDGVSIGPSSSYPFNSISTNHTISASFTIDSYLITVNSAHGSPTASSKVNYGSNFKASVTSPEIITSTDEWICTGFSIDGGALQTGTSYNFTNVISDHTISFAWTENFLSTVIATTSNGTISIPIQGNVTSSQISNATVNSTPTTFTISLTFTGPTGTAGFCNMTIPKNTLPAGYVPTPAVYVDGQLATSQGYTWDATTFYIWYTLHFSTHQVALQFPIQTSPSPSPSPTSQPTPSPTPVTTPSPTPSPTTSPTSPPTATPTLQPTPVPTPGISPGPTSAPTATVNPTQTPPQTQTNEPTASPPNLTASESTTPTQTPTSVPILPYEKTRPTPAVQPDPSTAGLLTVEMAGIFAFVVAILVIVVLIFKKAKR